MGYCRHFMAGAAWMVTRRYGLDAQLPYIAQCRGERPRSRFDSCHLPPYLENEMKQKYKLLCWNEYQIPVPLWAKWMAMDLSGDWWIYKNKPIKRDQHWSSYPNALYMEELCYGLPLDPPEAGPWTEQLYKLEWI